MNLSQLIEQYIAFRKSLGEIQDTNAQTLRMFGRFIGGTADVVEVSHEQVNAFLAGKGQMTLTWHHKLGVLRSFYRYAVTRDFVPSAPLPTVIPRRPPSFVPYIFSPDDLQRLLRAIDSDTRYRAGLEPITVRTIVLLLYGTGLRVQEALNLNHGDIDLGGALLTVRQTKFGKTRLVPVGPQLRNVLVNYASRSNAVALDTPFFKMRAGNRVSRGRLEITYRYFRERAGIARTDGARHQPRLHDLRHSFAVHRLTSWYRQGADVQKLLPQLSVYLGHVCIRHTQIYLSMTPELLCEAGQRFEQYVAQEVNHD
jgi:site-specific recombinase XerD